MIPITDFLSCTHVFDEFESLSPEQQHHAKTYATGLVAASNKTVADIAKKETDEDEENPVKYLVTNKIDAPTEHVIRSYGMRWRIEMFFEDSKQDLGIEDCELQTDEGASRHWHLLMAAYSLIRLDPVRAPWGRFARKRHRFERTSNIP